VIETASVRRALKTLRVSSYVDAVARVACESTRRTRSPTPRGLIGRRCARHVINGTRWLLLKNREKITAPDQVLLAALLAANTARFALYALKDELKQLWQYRAPHAARHCWTGWYARAVESESPR
jgi:transposase